MSENFENNDFSSETVSDVVSGVEKAPKKKTGVIVGGVCAGVVAVAAIGGVAAYNLSDVVKNKIKLATMKPAEYYSWVTETNAEKSAESAAESFPEPPPVSLPESPESSVIVSVPSTVVTLNCLLTSFLPASQTTGIPVTFTEYVPAAVAEHLALIPVTVYL